MPAMNPETLPSGTRPLATACYHCGLPVPAGTSYAVDIMGEARPMCCRGCEAVARAIVDNGLDDFYRYRTETAERQQDLVPEVLRQAAIYDNPKIQQSFVRELDGILEATLMLEGITCAACIWLNERHIASLPGVTGVQINYATQRATVRWDNRQIKLSDIIRAIADIGYIAHPYEPSQQRELFEKERKQHLYRLGIAGLMGMQVMMIAIALYGGDWWGMQESYRILFYWVSLLLTLPVITYSAQPFFKSAWRDLKLFRTGMDVPVSIGILAAFTASLYTTLTGDGHVYYDAVVMFVFFLSTARYFEFAGRRKSLQATEQLVHLTPTSATRMVFKGKACQEEIVPVVELNTGDLVMIRPGETVPADGTIAEGNSSIDESLLTGESMPRTREVGDQLIGGSINIESPLTLRIEKVGQDTVLSHMHRLLERAQNEKPAITQFADRIAGWFVLAVLLLAVMVASYWWFNAPERWFPITLAVLVATCPCALSLATPAAISAATGRLTDMGIVTARSRALETFARITHIVFDKTGTLTQGNIKLLDVKIFSTLSRQHALQYAAALERSSEHPISRAIRSASTDNTHTATNIKNTPGHGLEGNIAGQPFFLGSPKFIMERCQIALSQTLNNILNHDETVVLLAEPGTLHAAFIVGDELRTDAKTLVKDLQQNKIQVMLYSGDHAAPTKRIAHEVGINDNAYGELTPEDKLARVSELQSNGAIVAMVGDGINDAPVLAGADVSIAMGNSTHLAMTNADMILLNEKLVTLSAAQRLAQKTKRIIRQNIIWAIGYNLTILPAAAAGFVAPWMAAIGMSLSSLLVVANALRLNAKTISTEPNTPT